MKTKSAIMTHRSKEMTLDRSLCLCCGTTPLIFDDENTVPDNGFKCEECNEPTCDACEGPDGICLVCAGSEA